MKKSNFHKEYRKERTALFMLIVIFLLVHLMTVLLFLYAKKTNRLFLDPFLLVFLCLFPVVGAISVLFINKERVRLLSQPQPSFEEVVPWLSDESPVQEIGTRNTTVVAAKAVIPFQEALLLNHATIKRELIIDVIFEAPDRFIPLLHQARLNDDVEVVHYATTILSELTAQYDTKLHDLKKQMEHSPDSLQAKKDYLSFLQQYIDSQLAEGYYGNTLRRRYIKVVQHLLNQDILLEKEYVLKLAGIYLEFEDMQQFEALLEKMQLLFPEEEETWMLRLKAIIAKNAQQELPDFLDEIKEKHIYLSAKNREILAFWQ